MSTRRQSPSLYQPPLLRPYLPQTQQFLVHRIWVMSHDGHGYIPLNLNHNLMQKKKKKTRDWCRVVFVIMKGFDFNFYSIGGRERDLMWDVGLYELSRQRKHRIPTTSTWLCCKCMHLFFCFYISPTFSFVHFSYYYFNFHSFPQRPFYLFIFVIK